MEPEDLIKGAFPDRYFERDDEGYGFQPLYWIKCSVDEDHEKLLEEMEFLLDLRKKVCVEDQNCVMFGFYMHTQKNI